MWWTNNTNRDFRLNRNPNGATHGTNSDFIQYFGNSGPGSDYSIYVRIGSTVYEIPITQLRSSGGHYLNLTLDAADAATFNSVSVGDTVAVVIGRNLMFTPPTADAGNDQSVTVGQSVSLNGSGSSGDSLSYSWRQISGQTVVLTGEDTSSPSFTAPSVTGDLVFELRVTDNVFVETDNVTVTVSAALTIPSFADDTGDAQTWTVGTAIAAITVPTASGTPTPTYSAISGLPAGVVFDTSTRVISGTPTGVGSGTIRIRATNSEGSDDWTVGYTTSAAPVPVTGNIRLDSLSALDAVFVRADTGSNQGAWAVDADGTTQSTATGPGDNSAGPYVYSESSGSDATLPDVSTLTVLDTVMAAWTGTGRVFNLRACLQGTGTYPNDSASGLEIQGRASDGDPWTRIDLLEGWAYSF